jgi:hypothetical protein
VEERESRVLLAKGEETAFNKVQDDENEKNIYNKLVKYSSSSLYPEQALPRSVPRSFAASSVRRSRAQGEGESEGESEGEVIILRRLLPIILSVIVLLLMPRWRADLIASSVVVIQRVTFLCAGARRRPIITRRREGLVVAVRFVVLVSFVSYSSSSI